MAYHFAFTFIETFLHLVKPIYNLPMSKEKKQFIERDKEIELEEVKDDQPVKDHYDFPWKSFLIVFGVLITLIIVCVIVILCNGGFFQWSKN